jgi:coproporphyrinogen III oxidase
LHTKILTHDGHCEEREDYFSIKAHSESRGMTRLYFDNLYKKKGSFTFCAYTLVGLSAESSARDIATVTVK